MRGGRLQQWANEVVIIISYSFLDLTICGVLMIWDGVI